MSREDKGKTRDRAITASYLAANYVQLVAPLGQDEGEAYREQYAQVMAMSDDDYQAMLERIAENMKDWPCRECGCPTYGDHE